MKFTPTPQQEFFTDWIAEAANSDGIIGQAVPGAGKSRVLTEMSNVANVGKSFLTVAFTKEVSESLAGKMPKSDVQHIHKLCYGAIRGGYGYVPVEESKSTDNLKTLRKLKEVVGEKQLGSLAKEYRVKGLRYKLAEWVGWVQSDCTDLSSETALMQLSDTFEIVPPLPFDVLRPILQKVVMSSLEDIEKRVGISFDEMIYGAAVLPRVRFSAVNYLAVDEGQDMTACKIAALSRVPVRYARIGMGDRYQAIYSFTGVRPDSLDQLKTAFRAEEYPLSWSFRCPINVVKLANKLNPDMVAAPGNQEGIVDEIDEIDLIELLNRMRPEEAATTAILSRTNLALIKLALQLVRRGIPCYVRGGDICQELLRVMRKAQEIDWSISNLNRSLVNWLEMEMHAARFTNPQRQNRHRQVLTGVATTLLEIAELTQASSFDMLETLLRNLLSESSVNGVNLMSAHRSKGLEFQRVFILDPGKLPMTWNGQTEAEAYSERMLEYVAYTRSMHHLTFVRNSSASEGRDDL